MPTPTLDEAIALARVTPLTRGAVAELARKVPAALAREAALAALDAAGVQTSMVLAFAAAAGGTRVDPSVTRALLPEVLSLDQAAALAHATEGGAREVLALFLDDRRGDLELECYAMLLAAAALGPDEPVPRTLLTRGRWLARHQLTGDASVFLGGAVLRIRDANLSSLAAPHVNRARRAKRTIDDVLAAARQPPLEALPDADGARVSSGFTVRHETPSVGRNDPCPCGSGKKYKKCHALAESAPSSAPIASPRLDARALGPDQVALLRPSEIATLETAALSPKAFVEAFRRVVDHHRWDLVLRMIEEARTRADVTGELGEPANAAGADKEAGEDDTSAVLVSPLVLDALHGAYATKDRGASEALHALLPSRAAAREAFAIECLRAPPDLLARIEREAELALRNDADGGDGMVFASALLRWFPALGVYVARGALHESRTRDSQALLERIEDARDRLLLSPFEAWWDVYDAFFDASEDRREQKKDDARKKKLADDLRRARAASRKANAELEKLQQRVVELDEGVAATGRAKPTTSVAAPAQAPSAEVVEERRRLKTKIDELQRIIGEGQDERKELRRQLADREEAEVETPPKGTRETRPNDEDDELESDEEGAGVDSFRGTLIPRYSDRASKAVLDLAADAADGVLGVVAALAAGKPNAWGGVKQLTKVRGVLSARAGIHHRVLFSVNDRALDVLEVLHRRDLEQAVTRLARVG